MSRVVLLTGGIGSGKSAVSEYLRSKGVPVYDCDSRTKTLYDTDRELVRNLEMALNAKLSDSDGRLDRKALAGIIFSSPSALSTVEAIVHPAVLADFEAWHAAISEEWQGYLGKDEFVVMESAIALGKPLFDASYDAVVLVDAPVEMRIERAMKRDGCAREDVERRIMVQNFDLSRVNAVINNDLDLETLSHRTDIAFKLLYL